jgi:hypothetical protein
VSPVLGQDVWSPILSFSYSAVVRCAKFVGAHVTACLIDMLKLSTFRTLRIFQFSRRPLPASSEAYASGSSTALRRVSYQMEGAHDTFSSSACVGCRAGPKATDEDREACGQEVERGGRPAFARRNDERR